MFTHLKINEKNYRMLVAHTVLVRMKRLHRVQ